MVVCDENKIKDRIFGTPDLISEDLSPSTSLKDKREKSALYERFGVKEYIIAYPEDVFIERCSLIKKTSIEPDVLGTEDILKVSSLEEIKIPLWDVFEVKPPEEQVNNTNFFKKS